MKFENLFCNKSYIVVLSILILISGFSSKRDLINNNNQAIESIQDQLDELINKLEKKNINNFQPILKDANQKGSINNKFNITRLDFSDEVIEAFQSLNHDFLEYENILSSKLDSKNEFNYSSRENEENNRIKNLYNKNEENFRKLCNLHNENNFSQIENNIKKDGKQNSSTKKYYEEIESLTSDISNSFETFDKLEKIEENKKLVKEKLSILQEIKEAIYQMKDKIDAIKNKKIVLAQKRQNIKEISERLFKLYEKYLSLEKTINLKTKVDLNKIKNMISESHKSNQNIQNYLTMYDEILKFYKKINIKENDKIQKSNVEDMKNKFENIGKFLSKINDSDEISTQIR